MTQSTAAFIPANRAYWCESCSGVSDSHACARCGSASTHPVMAWLDRKESKVMVEHEGTQTRIWREA